MFYFGCYDTASTENYTYLHTLSLHDALPISRPEQISVTSGAQNGLTLVLRALTGPGDRVAGVHPTYHNALGAISRNSCQPVPISLPRSEERRVWKERVSTCRSRWSP